MEEKVKKYFFDLEVKKRRIEIWQDLIDYANRSIELEKEFRIAVNSDAKIKAWEEIKTLLDAGIEREVTE